MRAAPFEYYAPSSLQEGVALLAELGDGATLLAGGQSLIPLMNMRLARPRFLVDLNRLTECAYVREDGDELAIGALTRHYVLEESELVRSRCPLLTDAVALVGQPQIRSRGTVGGSIAHADPSAELPTALLALDGRVVVEGPDGAREIAARDFFVSYLTTSLAPGEIVSEIRVPKLAADSGWGFSELELKAGDFAIVACAALLRMGPDGRCRSASLALAGVGSTPVRVAEAEESLVGTDLNDRAIAEATRIIANSIDPEGDIHAPAEYRRRIAGVFVRQAIDKAKMNATTGNGRG